MTTTATRQDDACVAGASLKKRSGNKFWLGQIYRRHAVSGKKIMSWNCTHRHTNRDAAVECAQAVHHAMHGR